MAFNSAPSPYSISPEAYIALSQLNLQNPGQSQGQPVSSYGLTQGQPAVQSNTQAALQQALSAALGGGSSLKGLVNSFISNPAAAQQFAGSTSSAYTPQQPANAWRLNFDGTGHTPLFPGGTLATPNPTPVAPAPATSTNLNSTVQFPPDWTTGGGSF